MSIFPEQKEGIAYLMEFPDGKKYVGITTTGLRIRLNNHSAVAAKATTKVAKAIRDYGIKAVNTKILDTFQNKEEAFVLEKKYIKEFDTIENGYNSSRGGMGTSGVFPNSQTRKKMSEIQIKRFSNEETRKEVGIKVKEWVLKNPEKHQLALENRLKTFSSKEYRQKASDIRSKVAIDMPEIGRNHSVFMNRLYEENPERRLEISRSRGGTSVQVIKDNEIVGTYSMISECAKELGLSAGNIHSVINGDRKHTKGYTFQRINDKIQ